MYNASLPWMNIFIGIKIKKRISAELRQEVEEVEEKTGGGGGGGEGG